MNIRDWANIYLPLLSLEGNGFRKIHNKVYDIFIVINPDKTISLVDGNQNVIKTFDNIKDAKKYKWEKKYKDDSK